MAFQIKADIPKSHNNIVGFYTQSLVEDGDLNIINQVPAEMAWLVTEKLNSPDTHSYAGAILLWPVFFYSYIIERMGLHPNHCLIHNYDEAQALATLLYGLLAMALTISILTHFGVSKKLKLLVVLAVLIGTPFWWAVFVQPSGREILGAVSITLALWYLAKSSKFLNFPWLAWVGLGALFGFSGLVQFDLLIYIFLPFLWIFYTPEIDKKKTKLGLVALGVILVIGCHFINSWIKFGSLGGYFDLMIFDRAKYFSSKFFLVNEFLGPNGILFTTPVYGVGIFGLALALTNRFTPPPNKLKNNFIFILAILFPIVVALSFTQIRYNNEYGGLRMVSHQIVVILGICCMFAEMENRISRYAAVFLISIFTVWGWVGLQRFLAHPDTFGLHYLNLDRHFFDLIFQSLYVKSVLVLDMIPRVFPDFVIWLCFCFIVILIGKLSVKRVKPYIYMWFFPALFILATFLNLVNSDRNISVLDTNFFFKDKVIGNGLYIYRYDDTVSYLDKVSEWAISRSKIDLLADLDRYKKYFSDRASQQAITNSELFYMDPQKSNYRIPFWRKKVGAFYYSDCRDKILP